MNISSLGSNPDYRSERAKLNNIPNEERVITEDLLSPENKIKRFLLTLEIPDYKIYDPKITNDKDALRKIHDKINSKSYPYHKFAETHEKESVSYKDFIEMHNKNKITYKEFIEIYQKIRDTNEIISTNDLKRFQAGITLYKNNPELWKVDLSHKDNFKKSIIPLIKASVRISTNNETQDVLVDYNHNSANKLKEVQELVEKMNRGNDLVSKNLKRVIWYMEQLGFNAEALNTVFDFFQKIEIFYRNSERKNEMSQAYEDIREYSVNHLLRVMRITLGLLESGQHENFADFQEKEQQELREIMKNPRELCVVSLITLGHDLLEDKKITKEDLFILIKEICEENYSKEESLAMTKEVVDSVSRLNSYNYTKEDSTERDYPVYIHGHGSPGDSDYVRPLNLKERFVKSGDMLHNYQSGIRKANKEKVESYDQFIAKNSNIITLSPQRVMGKILLTDIDLASNENWSQIVKSIDLKYIQTYEQNLMKHPNWGKLKKLAA